MRIGRDEIEQEIVVDPIRAPDRLAAMASYGLSGVEPDTDFDEIVAEAKAALQADAAVLNTLDEWDQVCRSAVDGAGRLLPGQTTPVSSTFCESVVRLDRPVLIHDVRQLPGAEEFDAVASHGVAAYLGVPVRTPTGEIVAVLCALHRRPRLWREDDVRRLEAVADLVAQRLRARVS